MLRITLPLPPSVNQAYAGYPKRHKSDKYKEWEELAFWEAKKQLLGTRIVGDDWIEVRYYFHMPLFYKNGNKKKQDVFNYEKLVSDLLGKVLEGFDDSLIIKGSVQKINSDSQYVICEIET